MTLDNPDQTDPFAKLKKQFGDDIETDDQKLEYLLDNTFVGLLRKPIYQYLESQGFEITDKRHTKLRTLLKEYANKRTEKLQIQLQLSNNKVNRYEAKLGIANNTNNKPQAKPVN